MSALSSFAPSSERRLAANRANSQLSTGPCTAPGKAVSSLNAVKSGLTGRTVLLPSEDAEAYRKHIAHYGEQFQPVGPRELFLVQNLADTQWRLDRIPNLETGLFALGRHRYAELFENEGDPQVRKAVLDAHILMTEAKHFKNLHLQESRLRRQYRQDAQELKALQAQRQKEQEETQLAQASAGKSSSRYGEVNGFEFTKTTAVPFKEEETRTDNSKKGDGARFSTGSV